MTFAQDFWNPTRVYSMIDIALIVSNKVTVTTIRYPIFIISITRAHSLRCVREGDKTASEDDRFCMILF